MKIIYFHSMLLRPNERHIFIRFICFLKTAVAEIIVCNFAKKLFFLSAIQVQSCRLTINELIKGTVAPD
jgi:hypothetical protein